MRELFRRRNLPHWDVAGERYFITTCLEGSIPARGLLEIERLRQKLKGRRPPSSIDKREWDRLQWKQLFAEYDRWLDLEPAARYLEDERLANQLVESFYFFAGTRYDLWAFVVMPSHIHWVFRPLEEYEAEIAHHTKFRSGREAILKSFNGFTAKRCNQLLDRSGTFWQSESYDHWIRDDEEFERVIDYVENNPVKAGLVESKADWPWSSAHDRVGAGYPREPAAVATDIVIVVEQVS